MSSIIVAGDTSGSITLLAPTVAGTGTLTLPVATDTLVGKATTDTLTNKTLTSPTLTSPTLTTPALGTVASGVISACTSTGMVLTAPALGTPTSGNLANCTGIPAPAALGTPTSGNLANCTGIPAPAALTTASGSAPSYSCRAWVNFNGTGTVAVRTSGNISSVGDGGVGAYTINFTTAMADANYCAIVPTSPALAVSLGAGAWFGGVATDGSGVPTNKTASAVNIRMGVYNGPGASYDTNETNVCIFR